MDGLYSSTVTCRSHPRPEPLLRLSAVLVNVTWLSPVTVKLLKVVTFPAGVNKVIGPVTALLGTAAVTWPNDVVNGAVGVPPPKRSEVALERLVPVMVTTVLGGPMIAGENPKRFGKIEKEFVLIMTPPGLVIAMAPGIALVGTVATICVGDPVKA